MQWHSSLDPEYVLEEYHRLLELVGDIKGALNTAEDGANLVQVARNACRAEQELAALLRRYDEVS